VTEITELREKGADSAKNGCEARGRPDEGGHAAASRDDADGWRGREGA